LTVEGRGRAFYYWTVQGVPLDGQVPQADAGLKARRACLDRGGRPIEGEHMVQGEVYQVRLSLWADEDAENVAVVDVLPAGSEIENPRLASTDAAQPASDEEPAAQPPRPPGQTPPHPSEATQDEPARVDRVERRDDRLILFLALKGQRWFHYTYLARAVTEGRFGVGPVRAECMYDPAVASVNGATTCVVQRHAKRAPEGQ
jgi:uncharacterized protein YfaS (alpha-2-macroglobulin family)